MLVSTFPTSFRVTRLIVWNHTSGCRGNFLQHETLGKSWKLPEGVSSGGRLNSAGSQRGVPSRALTKCKIQTFAQCYWREIVWWKKRRYVEWRYPPAVSLTGGKWVRESVANSSLKPLLSVTERRNISRLYNLCSVLLNEKNFSEKSDGTRSDGTPLLRVRLGVSGYVSR
jgi:hypothetical protein